MSDRIVLKWAVAGAVAYTLAALAMIGVPLLWGDTTARCKAAGFQAGAVFRAADADCLDTSPRNTFNSQISDTNIRAGAAIQGNKIDGVFASLISASPIVFSAPGIEVARLRSNAGIVLDAAGLASTGSFVFLTPGVQLNSLWSSTLVSQSATAFTDHLRLLSTYAAPDAFVPPPAGALFANTIFAAFALVSASPTTSVLPVLASYNVALVSEVAGGIYLVSLRRPMATDHYVVVATSTRVFGENDVAPTQHDTLASFHDSFGAFRRRYFTIIRRTGGGGTLSKSSFSFLVIGAQE